MFQKHRYKKDYEVRERGKKEKLIYKGNYYTIHCEKRSVRWIQGISLTLVCLIAAVFLGIGFLDNEGSRKIYIILPYIFMSIPVFYGFVGTVQFLNTNLKMMLMDYEHTVERIKKCSLSIVIMSIATAIGEVIYLVSNSVIDGKRLDYLFFGGIIVMGSLAMILLQLQKRYEVFKEKAVSTEIL